MFGIGSRCERLWTALGPLRLVMALVPAARKDARGGGARWGRDGRRRLAIVGPQRFYFVALEIGTWEITVIEIRLDSDQGSRSEATDPKGLVVACG